MKKQDDNPYYDLISLDEWSMDNDKRTVLLSHFPHMACGWSIRGIFDHFYEDAKKKEEFLTDYYGTFGIQHNAKDRMSKYVKQFVV